MVVTASDSSRTCNNCGQRALYDIDEYKCLCEAISAYTEFVVVTSYDEALEMRIFCLRCKTSDHITRLHFDVGRFRCVYDMIARLGHSFYCTHCDVDASASSSSSSPKRNVGDQSVHEIHNDSATDQLGDTSQMIVDVNIRADQESIEGDQNSTPSSEDARGDVPQDVVVNVHCDDGHHDCEFVQTSRDAPCENTKNKKLKECHDDLIAIGVLNDIVTSSCDFTPVDLTVASSSSTKESTTPSVSSFGDYNSFYKPGKLCPVHFINKNHVTLEDLKRADSNFDKMNYSQDELNKMKHYINFIVITTQSLHELLCEDPINVNLCLSTMKIAKSLSLTVLKQSIHCMRTFEAQRRIRTYLLSLPTQNSSKAGALNADGAVDVSSMIVRILMSVPKLVGEKPSTYSSYSSTNGCEVSLTEYVAPYLLLDKNYDIMNDYVNVRFRLPNSKGATLCKVPFDRVHDLVMNNTGLGLLLYKFMLNEIKDKPYIQPDDDAALSYAMSNIASGDIDDKYYDVYLKYIIPSDFFRSDEMTNHVGFIGALRDEDAANVVSWCRIYQTWKENEETNMHPLLRCITDVILEIKQDDDDDDDESQNMKLRQLSINVMTLKCNISNTIYSLREFVEKYKNVIINRCGVVRYDKLRCIAISMDNVCTTLKSTPPKKRRSRLNICNENNTNNKRKRKNV